MDDSHSDLRTFRSDPTSPRRTRVGVQQPSRLGQALREARQDGGLELQALAETTRIQPAHLEALEAGRLAELPGNPHGRNFVRRYAQAVGLDPARALILYAQERRGVAAQEATGLELPPEEGAAFFSAPWLSRFARLFASLLLVAAAIWLALRTFDGALVPGQARPVRTQSAPPATAPKTLTAAPAAPTAPAMILLSLQTTPPGAEVSIDGYRFGQSPISDAPVRAGNRTIKVSRGGYGTFERTLDLSRARRLNVTLFPKGAGEPTMTGAVPAWTQADLPSALTSAAAPPEPAPTTAAQVVVRVSAEAWLEVYRGDAREGERLVYETAEPGDTYSFSAPIYVFSGNAGGVSVATGNASPKPLGVSGAVVGKAY